jgi:hypothetical protein
MNISPVNIIDENNIEFYISGKSFTTNSIENTIIENELISKELSPLAWALDNFNFTNESLIWNKGIYIVKYNITEAKFYLGNSEMLTESITEFLLAAGVIKYDEKAIAMTFEHAAKNIDKYVDLDFVKTVNEKGNLINIMKLGKNVYISRINESARIYNFFKANNANAALEYVNEKTNVDISAFVANLLEGDAANRAVVFHEISNIKEMINFLKDSRGLLADADRSIDEIKEADELIEDEIVRFDAKIIELKSTI